MSILSPETVPIIYAYQGASASMADTCDWISLANARGCLITVVESGNNATDLILSHVHQGITNGVQGAIPALTTGQEFPIWINVLTTTTDAMVRQANGLTYTLLHSAIPRIVQFYVPAAILSPGYSWIQLGSSAGHASNTVSVIYQLDGERYKEATPPTAIA